MPKISKDATTGGGDHGPVIERSEQLDGYTVQWITFREDIDATPLLRGLPDDRCQCPHWGVVLKGRLRYETAAGEEIVDAGEAFYLPPGHTPVGNEPGTEFIQFSPSEPLREVSETLMRNMAAMQAG